MKGEDEYSLLYRSYKRQGFTIYQYDRKDSACLSIYYPVAHVVKF